MSEGDPDVVKVNTMDAYEVYQEGVQALGRGEFEADVRLLRQSQTLQPHFATARRLAKALQAKGESAEARAFRRIAHELNPRSDAAAIEHAEDLFAQGEAERAKGLALIVLKRNSTYGPAEALLARTKT